jgi:hypothetical protein
MSTAGFPLLSSRRFAPLFVTQFLGAVNDNLLKSALAIFVTYRLAAAGGTNAATLVMLAGGIFIAPFFLFSGASGTLADRVDKSAIARWVKIAGGFFGGGPPPGLRPAACRCCCSRSSASARTQPCSGPSSTRCCRNTCTTTSSSPATR